MPVFSYFCILHFKIYGLTKGTTNKTIASKPQYGKILLRKDYAETTAQRRSL